jgi:hypothetical protein
MPESVEEDEPVLVESREPEGELPALPDAEQDTLDETEAEAEDALPGMATEE